MKYFLVTGLSGSGKSTALKALEDHGFYCIDNLPIRLFESSLKSPHKKNSPQLLALGMDVRDPDFIDSHPQLITNLKKYKFEIIFLNCNNKVIIQRFSESRRPHPYDPALPLQSAISEEREKLEKLMMRAHHLIDTSHLSVHDLKRKIKNILGEKLSERPLHITLISFGYKNGLPSEADLVFDVRFLKNPYFVSNLKKKTGLQTPVQKYVLEQKEAQIFLKKLQSFLKFLTQQYLKEGKFYLNLAIGCTGGQHRSVALVEELALQLKNEGKQIALLHRDL